MTPPCSGHRPPPQEWVHSFIKTPHMLKEKDKKDSHQRESFSKLGQQMRTPTGGSREIR
jgi:hypothetical protein